jgi:D-alanyl-D-alanine carboxypeptidase
MRLKFLSLAAFLPLLVLGVSCRKQEPVPAGQQSTVYTVDQPNQAPVPKQEISTVNTKGGEADSSMLQKVLDQAKLPGSLAASIQAANAAGPSFLMDLLTILGGDPSLYALVDKTHPLPDGYVPPNLVTLPRAGAAYTVSRKGLQLRKITEQALETMAEAAKADGITLMASSTYRSFDYQKVAYQRAIDEDGQEAADRESAKPGYSQHQTGLVIDFGTIDDSFADTKAGKWLSANAGKYGWSLSFPQGMEAVTGYRWDCWHYRYVGADLVHFIDTYFNGVQEYALEFINAWVNN